MNSQESLLSSPGYLSTTGYLKLENYHTRESQTFYAGVRKGLIEIYYEYYPECNGANQTVYVDTQGNLVDGRRCSTDKGLLSPIKDRAKLKFDKLSLAS